MKENLLISPFLILIQTFKVKEMISVNIALGLICIYFTYTQVWGFSPNFLFCFVFPCKLSIPMCSRKKIDSEIQLSGWRFLIAQ